MFHSLPARPRAARNPAAFTAAAITASPHVAVGMRRRDPAPHPDSAEGPRDCPPTSSLIPHARIGHSSGCVRELRADGHPCGLSLLDLLPTHVSRVVADGLGDDEEGRSEVQLTQERKGVLLLRARSRPSSNVVHEHARSGTGSFAPERRDQRRKRDDVCPDARRETSSVL